MRSLFYPDGSGIFAIILLQKTGIGFLEKERPVPFPTKSWKAG